MTEKEKKGKSLVRRLRQHIGRTGKAVSVIGLVLALLEYFELLRHDEAGPMGEVLLSLAGLVLWAVAGTRWKE